MDVRKKLVEILKQAPFEGKVLDEWWWEEKIVRIVDHLIANGVTVQEWILVKERKPDLELVEAKGDDFDLYACLATIKNDRARNGRYVGKAWYDGERFMDSDCVDITYNVTHWMPLPQPPKGE